MHDVLFSLHNTWKMQTIVTDGRLCLLGDGDVRRGTKKLLTGDGLVHYLGGDNFV